MDITQTITHVSLCAGYGGIDLGLGRAIPNLRTVAFSEIEAFACANLVSKMEAGLLDAAPIWTDLKTFPWAEFRDRVDILSGGYPCQPFSAAGKRLGTEDPRHLWPYIADGIRAMRPRICFFENVEGHISLGLREVISELEGLDYKTTFGIFSAREVGAPHQRKRVFILAYRHGERGQLPDWWREPAEQVPVGYGETRRDGQWPSRPGELQYGWEPPRVVADTLRKQSQRGRDLGELGSPASVEQGEAQQWERSRNSAGDQGEARVVANSESKRAGQRSELCGEECGSGSALSRDVEQSGEPMGDSEGGQDHGREPRDLGVAPSQGRCGDHAADCTSEGMGNTILHGHAPSEISGSSSQSEAEGWMQESAGGSASVGYATSQRSHRGGEDGLGLQSEVLVAGYEAMADNLRGRLPNATDQQCDIGAGDHAVIGTCIAESGRRQTQPPLGRDADGAANWMDYAELCVTCDNRTDELRLLGNGVVPATATRAFLTLMDELLSENL